MARVTSADGGPVSSDYGITGPGPTVVLIGAGPTDRDANAELAGLLAGWCTVVNYDRRGAAPAATPSLHRRARDRGPSGVVEAAGGRVGLFGNSGGAFVAFGAAASGMACERIAVWEPPYVLPNRRPRCPPTMPTSRRPWPTRATCRRDPGAPVRALPRERELARPGLWNDWKELLL
jgi:pimeloyl-ACP methyl ester carboxylesterase